MNIVLYKSENKLLDLHRSGTKAQRGKNKLNPFKGCLTCISPSVQEGSGEEL